MKKLMIAILALLSISLCCPTDLMARKYTTHPKPSDTQPIRTPIVTTMSLDEDTGEATLNFSSSISDGTIMLVQNGIVVDSVDFSANVGQTVYYELEDFNSGDYTLLISSGEDVIQTYYITIED